MKKFILFIVAILIIAAGVGGAAYLIKTKPQAERKNRPRMTPVVHCEVLSKKDNVVRLEVMGTVIPINKIELKAQVSGEITSTDNNWIEGGMLSKDKAALTLEDADYKILLTQAKSALAQAESELALEKGKQDIAKKEWELLNIKGSEQDKHLASRGPQLKGIIARVESAKSRVAQAKLDLDRTQIKPPFNALVLRRYINKGDIASLQGSLATLVDVDSYHVRAIIPVKELQWIEFPDGNKNGSSAKIFLPDGNIKSGEVVKLLGDLEQAGRMAQILIKIPDPLSTPNQPALLGSYVRAEIEGTTIPQSYIIKRKHYREGGNIWLITPDSKLHVLSVETIWASRHHIVFKVDISEGEKLITSDMNVPINNMELRIAEIDKNQDKDSKHE